jgi:hypothetical protein
MEVSSMQRLDLFMFPNRKNPTNMGLGVLSIAWVGWILGFGASLHGQEPKTELSVSREASAAAGSELDEKSQGATAEEVDQWIADLSSNQYEKRESATQRLAALGIEVLPKLKGRIETESDIEARTRLIGLIAQIEAIQNEKTIDAFLRDSDLSQDHGFSAWPKFQTVAGSNRFAKQLLIEIYKAQPKLADAIATEDLDEITTQANKAAEVINASFFRGKAPQVGDGLSLLFAGAIVSKPFSKQVDSVAIRCIQIVPLASRINEQPIKKPLVNLLDRWLTSLQPENVVYTISGLQRLELPNSLKLSREILKGPYQNPPVVIDDADALIICSRILSRFGNAADLDILDPWLDDLTKHEDFPYIAPLKLDPQTLNPEESSRNPTPVLYSRWHCDITLYFSLVLARQPMKDYFPNMADLDDSGIISINSVGFPSNEPELRTAAIKRFREFRASQNKPQ